MSESPDSASLHSVASDQSVHSASEYADEHMAESSGDEPFVAALQRPNEQQKAHQMDENIRSAIARMAGIDSAPNYSVSLYSGNQGQKVSSIVDGRGDAADGVAITIPERPGLVQRVKSRIPFLGKKKKSPKGLGTVTGVLIPCTQNILGVILFLRLTWITGEAGWLGTVGIVSLCAISTLLTAISMSAVATNGQVKAGGAYYMISRSLGPEMGTSVGVLFFLATTAGCAMYVIGAAELFQSIFSWAPQGVWGVRLLGPVFLVAVVAVVLLGVKVVSILAPIFFAVMLLSIVGIVIGLIALPRASLPVSAYPGVWNSTPISNFLSNALPSTALSSFAGLLSVFYPSVTGIMAGANRSGALKNPARSIPVGTISAIAITTTLYLIIVTLFSMSIDGDTLRATGTEVAGKRFFPIAEVTWPTVWLVNAGIFASTIGAALQSCTGAPQLLQAIAADGLIPILRPMSRTDFRKEPIVALGATAAIAFCVILIGDMNLVTPITTMCFIMCYLSVNFSCALQGMIRSPSFRPTFRFYSWKIAGLTMVLCLAIMFVISWVYAGICIILTIAIYKYVQFVGVQKNWGDGLRGWRMQQARSALLTLDELKAFHPNNWRPQLLVLLTLATPERVIAHYQGLGPSALLSMSRHSFMPAITASVSQNAGDPLATIHTAQHPAAIEPKEEDSDTVHSDVSEPVAGPPLTPLHPELISFAAQLRKSMGLTVVGAVVEGHASDTPDLRNAVTDHVDALIARTKLRGFVQVISQHAETRADAELLGAASLIQNSGLGQLRPNTVLTAWPGDWKNANSSTSAYRFFRLLLAAEKEGMAVALTRCLHGMPTPAERATGTVDVFWFLHDGGLLLLLPYLLRKHKTWRRASVRLFTVAEPGDDPEKLRAGIEALVARVRIDIAEVRILSIDTEVQEYAFQRTMMMHDRLALLDQLHRPAATDADAVLDRVKSPVHRPRPSFAARTDDTVIKMDNAIKINSLIKAQQDGVTELTIVNMPGLRRLTESRAVEHMEYLDALTDGVGPCILLKGSGREVISGYNK